MTMKQININEVEHKLLAGDIIAFGGDNNVSKMIKAATNSVVSHVGIVINPPKYLSVDEDEIVFMEANFAKKMVCISTLSDKLEVFSGYMWHLPLSATLRSNMMKSSELHTFLETQLHKPYDTTQALKSAVDCLDNFPFCQNGATYNEEDFKEVFCSELVTGALEAGKIIGTVNASEVTPIEVCQWQIFEPVYFQLQGEEALEIDAYNSVPYQESVG